MADNGENGGDGSGEGGEGQPDPKDPRGSNGNQGGAGSGQGGSGAGGNGNQNGSGDDELAKLRQQLADAEADRDNWKKRSRQHEDRAKQNADDAKAKQTVEEQLAELRSAQEQRDAADLADKADLAGEKLQASLVRGGLSDDDAETLVKTIDPVRLLTDGKPDAKEIKKLADSLVKIGTRPAPDGDQGRRGGNQPPSMNQMIREAAQRTRVG